MRKILSETNISAHAKNAIESYHSDIVTECQKAVESNEWVIIGMGHNPHVKKSTSFSRR